MKRSILLSLSVFIIALLTSCQAEPETMVLLDEKIEKIQVTNSNGLGVTNEKDDEPLFLFSDEQGINVFKTAIRTALKQKDSVDIFEPDFDVYVEYKGGLPTHALHLSLGKENEKSMFMYSIDEENAVYVTSLEMSNKLRELLKKSN